MANLHLFCIKENPKSLIKRARTLLWHARYSRHLVPALLFVSRALHVCAAQSSLCGTSRCLSPSFSWRPAFRSWHRIDRKLQSQAERAVTLTAYFWPGCRARPWAPLFAGVFLLDKIRAELLAFRLTKASQKLVYNVTPIKIKQKVKPVILFG